MEKQPSTSDVELDLNTETTEATNRFSLDQVEIFRQKINQAAGEELFKESLTPEEIEGIIELYGRIYGKPMQVRRLLARLYGKGVRELAREESVDHSNIIRGEANAIAIIAKELDALFNRQESMGDFSVDQIEIFRQKINQAAGREVLEGPLSFEEVMGLLDIYGRKNRSAATVGKQITRLMAYLEGKNLSMIARDEGKTRAILSDTHNKAIEIITRELLELFPERILNNIEASINQSVQVGILSSENASVFKRHIGLVDEPLTSGQILRNTDTYEKLRVAIIDAKVRDRNKHDKKIDNLPSEQQQNIFKRLVGSQPDAIEPVTREELIRRYEMHQRSLAKYSIEDRKELEIKISNFSSAIDDAIYNNLQWILNPQYSSRMSEDLPE